LSELYQIDKVKYIKGYQLPSSGILIPAINKIISAFESPIEVGALRTRWEEIKKLQDLNSLAIQ
jgi:hypothetical protein